MKNSRKREVTLIISLIICLLVVTAAAPTKKASAASKFIKVDAFIEYVVTKLELQIDENSKTPYLDAAIKANILKKSDFENYNTYLTRTDCAVIANRVDKFIYGEYFGYPKEVYELLSGCVYVKGKLYYNVEGGLYPVGMNDITYPASQFLKEVVLPRLSPHFKFDQELGAFYEMHSDDSGKILETFMEIGLKNNTFSSVDPFHENDYLIQAWQKVVDGDRKFEAVYSNRISDLNKITKSKRRDVAEVVAKGIIKGYSNGMYIQNRSFKGSGRITSSGAKNVITLAMDKYARAPISPDGQLIRTTKLPKNASEYPYILECFPNDFYEMVFNFERDKPYIEGTMPRNIYHYPSETGNTYLLEDYKQYISTSMKPYEYYDTIMKQVKQYINCVFNVDYRTVRQDWIENVASSYAPAIDTIIYDKINRYLKTMKNNHVIVESKIISLEPSTLYEYDNNYYVRVYAKYRVTADTIEVEDDYELIFGSISGTYLVDLKNGEWTYGYYDIYLRCSNINDPTYMEFGMEPWTGISDGAFKGTKKRDMDMMQNGYKTNKWRYVVPVVMLALSFFIMSLISMKQISAEEYDVVTNSYWYKEINDNMKIEMLNGVITIKATSKAAEPDTVVRYQTIGFGVSLSNQTRMITKKVGTEYYTGPDSPENIDVLWLIDAEKVDLGTKEGWVTTGFVFSAAKVNKILGGSLNNITNSTMIYLNAVFQSYLLNSDGSKDIRKGENGGITSWESMMYAESWGSDSLAGFGKYYNIPVKFSPGPQPITLYDDILSADGNKISSEISELNSENINKSVTWRSKVDSSIIEIEGIQYSLKGCYVEPKESSVVMTGTTSWNPLNKTSAEILEIVKSASVKVPLGGMNIHVVYQEDAALNKPYPNKLYYLKDGAKKPSLGISLPSLKIGEKLSWMNTVASNPPSNYYTGQNILLGYEIRSWDGKQILFTRYKPVNGGVTDADLLDDTTIVVVGGVRVYLMYGTQGATPPAPSPTPRPGVTPTPGATPTPVPSIPPLVKPEGGYEYKPLDGVETVGEIRADIRGLERFNVLQAIPSTESLYTQVQGSEYNIGYQFTKKVVIKNYPIKVSKTFHLTWTDAKIKTKIIEEDVVITQTVNVERACAYWEIGNFDYYTLDKAVIINKALPGGTSVMYPNVSYYTPPNLVLSHTVNEEYHIIEPKQVKDGISLGTETPPQGIGVKPVIAKQDFTYEGNVRTDEIKVRNDYLSFNGTVVMNNNIYEKETPNLNNIGVLKVLAGLSNRNTLYKYDMVIPALTKNDYYYSTGTLTYRNHLSAVGSSGNTYDTQIRGLNNVIVHTPVICDATIKTAYSATGITSNDPYVQALKVDEDCVQLVLDPDDNLSDFTVDINNYGKHLSIPGYFTRDFAWGLRDTSVSYLAQSNSVYRNEVKFPFDVFYRKTSQEDEYIPKNTWMRFGHNTPTFYLPMWVKEGIYALEFRTVAVNGVNTDSQLAQTQTYANMDRSNYVATDSVRVQVSGRIYGLSIYDVTDYPTWETVFRKETGSSILKINDGYPSGVTKLKYSTGYSYDYTVGVSNQYGLDTGRLTKFTLPLVNGSHPKITNVGVLKTGYAVKFKVTTTGSAYGSGDSVLIKPKFYYVDAAGMNRQEVDVYYTESFNNKNNKLVKMGNNLDLTNIKNYRCGDLYMGIPTNQLKLMADIKKKVYGNYLWEKTDLFTYTNMKIRSPLMTYVNTGYLLALKSGEQYSAMRAAGLTDTDIVRCMQTYYAQYFFPAEVKVVEKGFDVYGYASKYGVGEKEAFWLTGGFIIINFDIVTVDADGNKNLSYINSVNAGKGYCSMWSLENPVPNKVSYNGKKKKSTVFNFLPGDFMVYYTDRSIQDDYVSYIIN